MSTIVSKRLSLNARKKGVKEQVIAMAQNGSGIRDTSRVLKISVNTVIGI